MSGRKMIAIAKPELGEAEAAAAREAILSGWVTQGPQVEAFEREFATYTGAALACAVSNCTTALHLALHVLGVRAGDEVITVSHSFIATANVVRYCGATPVFVDVDPRMFNMDPALIEKAITKKTKVIMPVHQVGMPCDMAAILAVAKKHGLPVVEDAACAIGSELNVGGEWQRIGRPHGTISCFSFHPRKIITTGDGGMLTTSDKDLDKKFRLLRQHAMNVPDTVRHSAKQVIFEQYPEVGFNYRMTDIQAAVGREQLKRLPGIMERRRKLAARYAEELGGVRGLSLPFEPEWARSNFQSYAIRVMPEYGMTRDELMQHVLDRGVSTRRGIMNSHQEEAYAGMAHGSLVESEKARDSVVLIPLFHSMTDEEQGRVIEELKGAAAIRNAA